MQCTRQIARRFVQHVDIDYLVFPVVPVLSKSGTGGGVALMWHHRRTIAGRRGGREQGLHRRPEGRTDGRPLNSQPNCHLSNLSTKVKRVTRRFGRSCVKIEIIRNLVYHGDLTLNLVDLFGLFLFLP